MEQTHWEPNDRLYALVNEIYDKLHHFNTHCFYLSMETGVGKPRRK